MLFSRVYSWIKYKTLPPSVLFLNRLYVERDSKSRRVTSNLGLTFRNSKWSTYARTNINLKSKSDYLQLIYKSVALIILLIALFNFTTYYSMSYLTEFNYTLLWFVLDADLYLRAIFGSALLCSVQLTISSIYNRLFFPSLTLNLENGLGVQEVQSSTLPKRLHKPLLYALLRSSSDTANFSDVFDSSPAQGLNLDFYRNLFLTTRLLKLTPNSLTSSLQNLRQGSMGSHFVTSKFNALPLSGSYTLLTLDYLLFNRTKATSGSYFTELNKWSLANINQELAGSTNSLKSLEGLFYAPVLKNSKLSQLSLNYLELSGLKHSLENQTAAIRWQRWLYKYNLLHRSTLTGAQQINAAKKLINSGFYTSTLSTNNIWASSVFTGTQEANTKIQDLQNMIYNTNPTWLDNNVLSSSKGFLNSSNLETLKFYESSYAWFVKRFYNLNTLATNKVALKPVTRPLSTFNTNVNNFNTASSMLDQDLTYLSPSVSSSLDSIINDNANSSKFAQTTTNDLYLNYYENTFLTKGRLDLIQNLVKNQSTSAVLFYGHPSLKQTSRPNY